jgi:hypothetical protein
MTTTEAARKTFGMLASRIGLARERISAMDINEKQRLALAVYRPLVVTHQIIFVAFMRSILWAQKY